MQPEETYKYLEIPQKEQVDHRCLKKIFMKRTEKVTEILNTKLSVKNQMTALNIWASRVLTYSFGIVKGLTQTLRAMTGLQEDYLLISVASILIHLQKVCIGLGKKEA